VILYPTAVQTFLNEHDTAASKLLWAPAGLGTLCSRHREPFQRSANGAVTPERFEKLPTAVQLFGDAHETDDSVPYGAPGAGTAPADQLAAAAGLAANQHSATATHPTTVTSTRHERSVAATRRTRFIEPTAG
jgi:hypothetical protein